MRCIFADGQTHESKMVLVETKMASNSVFVLFVLFFGLLSFVCVCGCVGVGLCWSVCAESSPNIVFQQQDGGVG